MTPSDPPLQSFKPAADVGAAAETLQGPSAVAGMCARPSTPTTTLITQVNKSDLTAMAVRLETTESRVIEIALGRLYLSLFEGELSPGSGFFWETRIGTEQMFETAQVPPPPPSSRTAGKLLELLRQEGRVP